MTQSTITILWRFARGESAGTDFESWLYANHKAPDLEEALGQELLLVALEARYSDQCEVEELRSAMLDHLLRQEKRKCRCITWRDRQVLPMGHDPVTGKTAVLGDYFSYLVLARRTPWLECVICRECGQAWYLATDTSENDDYHLVRLVEEDVGKIKAGEWPTVFDDWDVVWPDADWLALFGYDSLGGWLADHPPDISAD